MHYRSEEGSASGVTDEIRDFQSLLLSSMSNVLVTAVQFNSKINTSFAAGTCKNLDALQYFNR